MCSYYVVFFFFSLYVLLGCNQNGIFNGTVTIARQQLTTIPIVKHEVFYLKWKIVIFLLYTQRISGIKKKWNKSIQNGFPREFPSRTLPRCRYTMSAFLCCCFVLFSIAGRFWNVYKSIYRRSAEATITDHQWRHLNLYVCIVYVLPHGMCGSQQHRTATVFIEWLGSCTIPRVGRRTHTNTRTHLFFENFLLDRCLSFVY